MAKGICISIGLNSVDPAGYDGWNGPLNACENDARDISQIAQKQGFDATFLLTERATSSAVLSALFKAAQELQSGDMLILSCSSHGGQIGDVTGDENDQLDETWCLFDRMVVDDELYAMWAKFAAGVRILVLSDSCHSGTVARMLMYKELEQFRTPTDVGRLPTGTAKSIPQDRAWTIYQKNKTIYDSFQYVAGRAETADIKASVLLISGCQDNQLSMDGQENGMFTEMLKLVWENGKFKSDYKHFHKEIVSRMPPSQTPNYYTVGATNLAFEAQVPFTL